MIVKLTKGVEHRDLACGCHLAWRVAPDPWYDFVRVDVSPDCDKPDHREEMGDGSTN